MRKLSLRLYVALSALRNAAKDDSGQDLVEYALVIAVICLGVVSGMGTLANGINSAMSTVSANLNNAIA